MEEVWKDICLSTLHHSPKTTATPFASALHQGVIFQEFLSRPPNTGRSISRVPSSYSASNHHDCPCSPFGGIGSGFIGSQGEPTSTVLSLNSSPPSSFSLPQGDSSDPLDSSTEAFSILPKKRVPENEDSFHRSKRMIKNRESAARSRARKQAYTIDLEIKVASLMEENAMLRRQQQQRQQQLCLGGPDPAQFQKSIRYTEP